MRRFIARLNHHYAIKRRIEAVKCSRVVVELVAEHNDQLSARSHLVWCELFANERACALSPRHRFEQNFTSPQFFAQDLRHTISRPHVKQIFEGSDALFPLKLKIIAK